MFIACVVAAAVGTIAGIGVVNFDRLGYWRRWDQGAARVVVWSMYGIYAAAGVGVTVLMEQTPVRLRQGAGLQAINGAGYGALTLALLRPDGPRGRWAPLSPAREILSLLEGRIRGWLDPRADRGVARAVGDLGPLALCRLSWRLALLYVEPRVDRTAARATLRWLRDLRRQALGADQGLALEARETLRHFATTLIVRNVDATIELPADVA